VVQGLDYSIANTEWRCSMSTPDVTPDLLRRVAAAWEGATASDDYARHELRARADHLERQQLPTVPGWYPGIVVERGGESCTGALLRDDETWLTAVQVDGWYSHDYGYSEGVTYRWAEQDGKTPGQTLWEETCRRKVPWRDTPASTRDRYGYLAAAVLAAHGTPTLTPVGEHLKPGTRGLLPVVCSGAQMWRHDNGSFICDRNSKVGRTVLADPRTDGAHE